MADDTKEAPSEDQGPAIVRTIPSTGSFMTFEGGKIAEIRSGTHSVLFADTLLEVDQMHGVVYFSLGAQYGEAMGPTAVEVVTRIRTNLVTAQLLRDNLDKMIKLGLEALKPTDKSTAN